MSQITKRALERSLKNMLLKKPLTKITVGDIADDCGINRMTFYYHFKDIYDLVEWSCLEDAKRALDEKKTYDTWQQGLLQIFQAVQENKPFITNVYRFFDTPENFFDCPHTFDGNMFAFTDIVISQRSSLFVINIQS